MKTSLKIYLVLAALAAFIWACSSNDDIAQMMDDDVSITDDVSPTDDDPDDDDPDNDTTAFENVNITVSVPDGVELDLSTATLFSLGQNSSINGSGTSEIGVFGNDLELAMVLDNNNSPILAGFISKEKTTISVETTAEVMAYFGVIGYLEQEDIKVEFLQQLETLPVFSSFQNTIADLFTSNNLMLAQGSYSGTLNNFVDDIASSKIEINNSSRVFVDENDIRSGIQLQETENNSIILQNDYPRRAHAFIYEIKFIDTNGQEIVLNSTVGGSDTSNFDFTIPTPSINPAQANRKKALIASLANCSNPIFTSEETSPMSLPIDDDQISVEYQVAVIGPGTAGLDREMTTSERATFERLSEEMFILDYLLPLMTEITGRKKDFNRLGNTKDAALYSSISPYLDNAPEVKDLVHQNDFESAMETYVEELYAESNGTFGDAFDMMVDVYNITNEEGNQPYNYILNDTQKERAANIGQVIADMTGLLSYQCINSRVDSSKTVETWKVMVEEGNVSLNPESMVTSNTADGKEIIARVLNGVEEGDQLEYEWSTSSTFGGFISDTMGNNGNSFTTDSNRVLFISTASNNELSDGDNIETVTVTVYRKIGNTNEEIGTDTMEVNVRKNEFKIGPDDAKVKGNQDLNLFLRNTDGETVIPNSEADYRVVWTISGNHGLLEGEGSSYTTFNSDSVTYQCTDTETENGTESVSAFIYARPKGSTEDYRLIDQQEVTINIENDDRYTYRYLTHNVWGNPPSNERTGDGRCTTSAGTRWLIPIVEDAESYTVRVTRFFNATRSAYAPQNEGRTLSWTVGGANEPVIESIKLDENGNPVQNNDDEGSGETKDYYVWIFQSGSRGSLGPSDCSSSFSEWYASVTATFGLTDSHAEVKIKLKPNTN